MLDKDQIKSALNQSSAPARVYLDWNATTPLRHEVFEAMRPFFEERFGNAASLHVHGQQAQAALEQARTAVAASLHCTPAEIAFTSGGTESDNLALRGLAWGLRVAQPDAPPPTLIASGIEHSAVRETLRALGAQGFPLVSLSAGSDGRVRVEDFAQALERATPSRAVVSLMLANNETGVIQPVAEVAALCQKRAVPLHVDAVQAAGKLALDLRALGCATLALSAHKFEGPKGCGALYVRAGTRLEPHQTGGTHEAGLRGGTVNLPSIVGLAEALRLAERERAETSARLSSLQAEFERELLTLFPRAVVHGAEVARLPNTSFISFPGIEGSRLAMALDLAGISVSTGSACSSGTTKPSPVLEAMQLPAELVNSAVRFSYGRTTPRDALQKTLAQASECLRQLMKL